MQEVLEELQEGLGDEAAAAGTRATRHPQHHHHHHYHHPPQRASVSAPGCSEFAAAPGAASDMSTVKRRELMVSARVPGIRRAGCTLPQAAVAFTGEKRSLAVHRARWPS